MNSMIKISVISILMAAYMVVNVEARQSLHEQNIQLVYEYWDAFTAGNMDAVSELLSEDFSSYGPDASTVLSKAEYLQVWRNSWENDIYSMTLSRTGTIPYTVDEGELAGEWVFDWLTTTVTYNSMPESPVNVPVHIAAFINGGKISVIAGYYDTGAIMGALGYTITPPSSE